MRTLKHFFLWLLDELCAATAYDWHGEFRLTRRDGMQYVEMEPRSSVESGTTS